MTAHEDQAPGLPALVYGSHEDFPGDRGYKLLAHDETVPQTTNEFLEHACRLWGSWVSPGFGVPPRGTLYHLSTPFESDPPRGVVLVSGRPIGLDWHRPRRPNTMIFHAAFLTDSQFAALDEQAFGLRQSGAFVARAEQIEQPMPAMRLDRSGASVPPLGPMSVGQVEALGVELRHLLRGGDVAYACAGPADALDEHLRVLQLGLPRNLRRELGFATLLARPSTDREGHSIFAISGQHGGRRFVPGRTRDLLPPWRPEIGSEGTIDRYVERYEELIRAADLAGLLQLGRNGL